MHKDKVIELNSCLDKNMQVIVFKNDHTVAAIGQGVRHNFGGCQLSINA